MVQYYQFILIQQLISKKSQKKDNNHNLQFDWNNIDLQNFKNQVPKVPKSFLWGFSSAAVQNEGNSTNNNMADLPGALCPAGDAINQWDLDVFEKDMALAQSLGTTSYRLVVDWSRIQPTKDTIDQNAIKKQREMIKIVIKQNMDPGVGIMHMSFPNWFFRIFDFFDEDNFVYWTEWCELAANNFGDLATYFTTMAEPNLFAVHAQLDGKIPNHGASEDNFHWQTKNLLKAHTLCYDKMKGSKQGYKIQVGLSLGSNLVDFTEDQSDLQTDKQQNPELNNIKMKFGGQQIKFFMEGIQHGGNEYQKDTTAPSKMDWIGINFQTTHYQQIDTTNSNLINTREQTKLVYSSYGMAMQGEGMYRALIEMHQMGIPMFVTEFGASDVDLHNSWLKRQIQGIKKQMDLVGDNHLLLGVQWWTLVSNWEWMQCFNTHFGMQEPGEDGTRKKNQVADLFKSIVQQSYGGDESGSDINEEINENTGDSVNFSNDNWMKWDWENIKFDLINQSPDVQSTFLWGFTLPSIPTEESAESINDNDELLDCRIDQQHEQKFADFKKDVQSAKFLGANSIRISIEWARIQPEEDYLDSAIIDWYKSKIDQVIQNGLKPSLTLWNFTLPKWFEDKGGFDQIKNIKYFKDYCHIIGSEFTNIDEISTMNEPNQQAQMKYEENENENDDYLEKLQYNLLKAHVACVDALKQENDQINTTFQLNQSQGKLSDSVQENEQESVIKKGKKYIEKFNKLQLDKWINFIDKGIQNYQNKEIKILQVTKYFDHIGVNQYHPSFKCYDEIGFYTCIEDSTLIDQIQPEGLFQVLNEVRKLNRPIMIGESGNPSKNGRENWFKHQMHALKVFTQVQGSQHLLIGYHYFTISDFKADHQNYCVDQQQGITQIDKSINLYMQQKADQQVFKEMIENVKLKDNKNQQLK